MWRSLITRKLLGSVALTGVLSAGCSASSAGDDLGGAGTGGGSASGGTTGAATGGSSGQTATGGSVSGGTAGAATGGSSGQTATGGSVSGGTGGSGGEAGQNSDPLMPDPCVALGTCPANTWVEVTPEGIVIPDPGLRSVVGNPANPAEIFMGAGEAGIWRSSDYGNTWTMVNAGFGYIPQGLCFAVLPTEPATLIMAAADQGGKIHKSTDAGATFYDTGGGQPQQLYSLTLDPYDGEHLLSGFHESDGITESTDAGETWQVVGTTGFPSGGISWYPFFIDTGAADTTAQTWLAIAQNGGSVTITHDGGASWSIPTGITGLQHPHGSAQIFQNDAGIFVPGTAGPGQGVYRSTDMGETFSRVSADVAQSVAWGTANHIYSMYSWSCFGCVINPNFIVSSADGATWASKEVPAAMLMGADHVTVTSDGTHNIFVAAMRNYGIWRYVEE